MVQPLLGSLFLAACLYVSLAVCIIGVFFRMGRWFVMDIGPGATRVSFARRIIATAKGIMKTVFSTALFKIFKLLIFDVLLQTRILKTDLVRWIMHLFIFFGFTMLLLMHALDEFLTKKVFPNYYSTLDPFQFLRNLFGVMVVIGAVIAVYRRVRYRGPMLHTRFADRYALIILAVIITTGFLVESEKITSKRVFNRMAVDFYQQRKPRDDVALKAFWAKENGTVFSRLDVDSTPEMIQRGKEVNKKNCASCHASSRTAFVSYRIARAVRPAAVSLDESKADIWLYYIHVLSCLLGLAYLPFSKLFHILADPISIIVNGLSDKKNVSQAAASSRRAMELDACTDCGTCSRYCSVEPVFRMMRNKEILPMNKLRTVRSIGGKNMSGEELQMISEGAFICTTCFKCTDVCPAGINLQDQWLASREALSEIGYPIPHVWVKKFNASEWSDRMKLDEASQNEIDAAHGRYYNLTGDSDVFAPCIQCQTCTNVCPVVAARTDSKDAVDITPQKIMNLLRLGLSDLAMGSRMVWDCVTCFQCQENCPQGIKVTEIIYELKNRAYDRFRTIDRTAKNNVPEDTC